MGVTLTANNKFYNKINTKNASKKNTLPGRIKNLNVMLRFVLTGMLKRGGIV